MSDESKVPAVKPPLVSGGKIAAIIPTDIDQAYRLAGIIASANMAPKSYNRAADAIMVAIIHGSEVGLPPMAALQSIAVINGMPTIWGDGALGLVRSSGLLEDISETIEGEGEAMVATCVAKRVGQATPIVGRFSVFDAKKAGLWNKQGPWNQYPKRMLQMRARSWCLRDGFADVLRGLRLTEEVRDMGDLAVDDAGDYRPAPPPRPTRAEFVEPEAAKLAEPDADELNAKLDAEYAATMSGQMPKEGFDTAAHPPPPNARLVDDPAPEPSGLTIERPVTFPDKATQFLYEIAEREAKKGGNALQEWFLIQPRDNKATVKPYLDALKALAARVDNGEIVE